MGEGVEAMANELRLSRRTFIAWVGGASAGFYLFGRLPGMSAPVALAAIPGGSLDPLSVPKYQTPLLIPPVMPKADTIVRRGQTVDYYEISMKQFTQQILPAGLPATTVWGYGAVKSASPSGLLLHNAPSLTIEAQVNRPVRVKWINDLADANGNYLPHLLPVDPTLHWANPPGGVQGRDDATRVHGDARPVHGPRADGHPRPRRGRRGRRQRRLRGGVVPAGGQEHPPGLRQERHLVPLLRGQGRRVLRRRLAARLRRLPVPEREPGLDDLVPRPRARHDAPERLRRPGGLLHRPWRTGTATHAVVDSRTGTPAVLPGPAPAAGDPFPPNKAVLRDPDRDPGSLVQRGRLALLSGLAGVLRRDRARLHPGRGVLADLEPGVLREHDHGQRQYLAVPDGGAAPLPVPLPQRLPVALPHPRLRRHLRASRSGRSGTRADSSPPR